MADGTITLDGKTSILFVGNSFTFGRVDPVMSYNAGHVRDLTAPSAGGTFTNTTGSNPYEPHPWGGVPGVFWGFTQEVGLDYDVALSTRNAATLQGHYLNSNPAGWDLRGNVASQSWDAVVLQDNSTQALPSGAGSVTFAPGQSTVRVTLTPIGDTVVETDETVGIQLSANGTYRVGTSSTLTGTILNGAPTAPVDPSLPTVTLEATTSAVIEDGSGRLVYTFTRSEAAGTPLTINFSLFRDGATAPSIATSGTNQDFETVNGSVYQFQSGGAATSGSASFTSNTGSITIAAGQTTATLTLDPKADLTVESNESIRLTLQPTSAYNVGTQGAVTATIVNDDFAAGTDLSLPNITAHLSKTSVYENGSGALVWEFTRSGSTADALTVDFGVDGTATLSGNDFTFGGATTFTTGGAANPNLASFRTYAQKLADYVTTGAADGTVPANPNANGATDVYLYETWARPNLVTGARVANTDETTGAVTTTTTRAPEFYTSLEGMTADLKAAYEGLAASNPIFRDVAPVGEAFLAAVQQGIAIRDPYTDAQGNAVGNINLWWDDNLHASKYGSYLSALTNFGTITGVDPRALGSGNKEAADLGIDPAVAAALQRVAAAQLGFTLDANWTAPGKVTELAGSATGTLASAGAFGFSDTNTSAVHTVTVAPATLGALGTLTASVHSDTTGDGSGGAVNWTYTVDNAAVEFLVAGQTRVERFTVTLRDQNGAAIQREVAITLIGVNDGTEDGPNRFTGGVGADAYYGLGGEDVLDGQGGNDLLDGGADNDRLDGGTGGDDMTGGTGNDTYVVDDVLDAVVEAAGGGTDTVESSITYTLGAHVENLVLLTGAGNIDGTGNGLGNGLTGNGSANLLDGGAGADILTGLGGNDSYIVDNAGDRVIEQAGGGTEDRVYARGTYLLAEGADIEVLATARSISTRLLDLTGNGKGQILYGNQGANVLDGGGGADSLNGFGGADTFAFSTALGADNVDRIVDFSAGDTIRLSKSVFAALELGSLDDSAFKDLGGAGARVDADDRILYDGKGRLFYDADGVGGQEAVLFAKLSYRPTLSHDDFLVA